MWSGEGPDGATDQQVGLHAAQHGRAEAGPTATHFTLTADSEAEPECSYNNEDSHTDIFA